MIDENKIRGLAEYFNFPVEIIQEFLLYSTIQFLFLKEKRIEETNFIEFCLLTKKGRFMRLLDHINSSVDIREAAQHIDSVEDDVKEFEIYWDGQFSNKQYYLILDYCPPLYCESNCS